MDFGIFWYLNLLTFPTCLKNQGDPPFSLAESALWLLIGTWLFWDTGDLIASGAALQVPQGGPAGA